MKKSQKSQPVTLRRIPTPGGKLVVRKHELGRPRDAADGRFVPIPMPTTAAEARAAEEREEGRRLIRWRDVLTVISASMAEALRPFLLGAGNPSVRLGVRKSATAQALGITAVQHRVAPSIIGGALKALPAPVAPAAKPAKKKKTDSQKLLR